MNDQDYMMAGKIVAFLNELLEIDKLAIAALMANRVQCSESLASHPTVQVTKQHGGFHVSWLGILNGLCGHDGYGPIAIVFRENPENTGGNDLEKFIVLDRYSEPIDEWLAKKAKNKDV